MIFVLVKRDSLSSHVLLFAMIILWLSENCVFLLVVNCDFVAIIQNVVKSDELDWMSDEGFILCEK